jgi:hypothetical protein
MYEGGVLSTRTTAVELGLSAVAVATKHRSLVLDEKREKEGRGRPRCALVTASRMITRGVTPST